MNNLIVDFKNKFDLFITFGFEVWSGLEDYQLSFSFAKPYQRWHRNICNNK